MTSGHPEQRWYFALIITLSAFCLSSLGAAETDWGGTLQTYVDGGNVAGRELTVGFAAGIWTETDFSQLARLNFSGGYGFQYDKGKYYNFPDLHLLTISGRGSDWSYKAGRFTLIDRNGTLFRALLDGIEYTKSGVSNEHSAGLGFTGLAFNRTSRVIMTAVDQRAYDNAETFSLASPRAGAYYEFRYNFQAADESRDPRDQVLSVAVLGEIDLRSADAVVNDNPDSSLLHSGFLQVGLNGRISKSVDYSVNGIFQAGGNVIPNDDRTLLLIGGLAEASVTWSPENELAPMVVGEFLYSSGDPWDQRSDHEGTVYGPGDTLYQYTAFTTRTAGYVFGSRVGNLVFGRVGASIRPAQALSLLLENIVFFRAVDGPVNEMPIDNLSGSDLYLGNEIILTVDIRPLSDLGFKIDGGLFLGNGNLLVEPVQYRFGASLSMSY